MGRTCFLEELSPYSIQSTLIFPRFALKASRHLKCLFHINQIDELSLCTGVQVLIDLSETNLRKTRSYLRQIR